MSEEVNGVSFSGESGKESQTVPQAGAEGAIGAEHEEGAKQEFLTRKEAESLIQAANEMVLRQTQSLTDKAASRMDKQLRGELKELNKYLERQKKIGKPVDSETENALRQSVYSDVLKDISEAGAENLDGQKSQLGTPGDRQNAVNAAAVIMNELAQDIYKESGVVVEESDPEAKEIDQSSPSAFLKSLRKAAEKKSQRVSTSPEARIPTLGKGQATTLEAQYEEEKKKIQGDVNALIALRKKYRGMGLLIE